MKCDSMKVSSLYRIIAVLLGIVFSMIALILVGLYPLIALVITITGLLLVRQALKQAKKERILEALA